MIKVGTKFLLQQQEKLKNENTALFHRHIFQGCTIVTLKCEHFLIQSSPAPALEHLMAHHIASTKLSWSDALRGPDQSTLTFQPAIMTTEPCSVSD